MRYRLLIVDDDPLNLDALTRVLRHDYELVRAGSPTQALQILRDEGRHIDLILADKSMPGRSGVELLEEAKGLSPAMRIVLTAYPDATDLMEAINRGEVYRYVTKPWSPEELKSSSRTRSSTISSAATTPSSSPSSSARTPSSRRWPHASPTRSCVGSTSRAGARPTGRLAVQEHPRPRPPIRRCSTAAKAIVQTLTRARERLREARRAARADRYFDVVARDCLAEARRILSVVEEVDEIAS